MRRSDFICVGLQILSSSRKRPWQGTHGLQVGLFITSTRRLEPDLVATHLLETRDELLPCPRRSRWAMAPTLDFIPAFT
jgi:hypothetical protein